MNGLAERVARDGKSLLCWVLLASYGAQIDGGAVVGGETHFLVSCGEDCGPGLSCIDGACTRACEPGFSSCSELSTASSCVSRPAPSREPEPFAGVCDVLCTVDADCSTLGAHHACRSGTCRADSSVNQMALSSARLTAAPLVRTVDADTCQSGLLWVGGNRGSAEMRPGSDCVGCHRETGARPLALGGTVYASASSFRDHAPDCFGLEGVEIIVTDSEGRQFSMKTNRAGNFYLEGDEAEFAMPYIAIMRWSDEGMEYRAPMSSVPAYGGCARCHGNLSAQPTPQPGILDPASILPESVIFPPGLYPYN